MRLSKSLCAVVGEVLASTGSHATLDELFISAGASGEPPGLSHGSKWKTWLFRCGQDPNVDSITVLGNLLEEFMDLPPADPENLPEWCTRHARVEAVLEENGLRYFRLGRVLPQGEQPEEEPSPGLATSISQPSKPAKVEELLEVAVCGLRRANQSLSPLRVLERLANRALV